MKGEDPRQDDPTERPAPEQGPQPTDPAAAAPIAEEGTRPTEPAPAAEAAAEDEGAPTPKPRRRDDERTSATEAAAAPGGKDAQANQQPPGGQQQPRNTPRRGPPNAALYVTDRWVEINDPHAPWWTRPDGIGIRLRLRELLDIAEAHREGATIDRPVSTLREEARVMLLWTYRFLKSRHKRTADQLHNALQAEREEPLPAYGLNYSIIEAAFRQLDKPDLMEALIAELAEQADGADDYEKLLALDEYIELLDAELAYDGHSTRWRHDVAVVASKAVRQDGADLKTAVTDAIAAAGQGWPKTVRFLVPVRVAVEAPDDAVSKLLEAELVYPRLEQWGAQIAAGTDFKLDDAAFEFEIEEVADLRAGAERANEWLEQELSVYRLQGGHLAPASAWLAVSSDGTTDVVERPPALEVTPDGLKQLEEVLNRDPTAEASQHDVVIADAYLQLAQARRSASGAALSDLWTVAEAVFAGAATEKSYLAGEVMAELLEYLYPLWLLDWMAKRLQALGLTKEGNDTDASWGLDQLDKHARQAFGASELDADPLLYVRSRAFGHWSATPRDGTIEKSERMRADLSAVSDRADRVAKRAYLVRNFYVHRAQPNRARALRATLPLFAEIVRVTLGYVASEDDRARAPITTAKLALMRIRQVAYDFETAREVGGGPLRSALGNDLRSD
jgi:hypothetical protein